MRYTVTASLVQNGEINAGKSYAFSNRKDAQSKLLKLYFEKKAATKNVYKDTFVKSLNGEGCTYFAISFNTERGSSTIYGSIQIFKPF